jgi:uncharacterized BrkB/YihY/UPF0761 family membrane protein
VQRFGDDDPQSASGRRAQRAVAWAQSRLPGAEYALEAIERDRFTGGALLAGGLAYRLFFWIVPFGLVLAAALSFWERADSDGLEDAAEAFGISGVAARGATAAIEQDAHSAWYFLIAGLVLLVWFSISAVRALRVAHAVVWHVHPEKPRRPLVAGMLFSLIMTSLILVTGGTQWLREELGTGGLLATIAIVVLYAAIALWMMTLLPHGDAPWTALVPGAVLLALGTQAMHLVVALYLAPKLGRSSELYGSLGASTVVLLWLYLTARLLIASAFLNATLWERKQRATTA